METSQVQHDKSDMKQIETRAFMIRDVAVQKAECTLRHGYAPFIPKCEILSQKKNVPWLHPSHITIPTLSDPRS